MYKCTFYTYESQQRDAKISYSLMIHRMAHVHQGHITTCDLEFTLNTG